MPGSHGHRLDSLQTQRLAAGLKISDLARISNTSDALIRNLEAGGNCEPHESQQIADALGVSLVTLGKKDL